MTNEPSGPTDAMGELKPGGHCEQCTAPARLYEPIGHGVLQVEKGQVQPTEIEVWRKALTSPGQRCRQRSRTGGAAEGSRL
jgi:hypothetical protein